MTNDWGTAMGIEEQFAAFSSGEEPGAQESAPAAEPVRLPLAAVPVPEVVSEVQPYPELEVEPQAVVEQELAPSASEAAPAEVVAETAFTPAPPAAGDEQTDSLLADLDRATSSLVGFREEIGRLVQLQRATAGELADSRRQLGEAREQAQDYGRLEGELSQQRSVVSSVRAKLTEAIAVLDGR
jgi:hypothetical protein